MSFQRFEYFLTNARYVQTPDIRHSAALKVKWLKTSQCLEVVPRSNRPRSVGQGQRSTSLENMVSVGYDCLEADFRTEGDNIRSG